MARFSGSIGYLIEETSRPGVVEQKMIYKPCKGDKISDGRRVESTDGINVKISLSSRFSIFADPFLMDNIGNIRTIKYLGCIWTVSSADYVKPRVNITTGGIYNGK